jgi:hypothetical protein
MRNQGTGTRLNVGIAAVFTFWYLPHPYSGNKISTFNGLRGGRRRKIFIPKEFSAGSRNKRTYGRFLLFSLFLYRIAIRGGEELCIFSLDFPLEFSLLKTAKNGATGERRGMVSALPLLLRLCVGEGE